MYNQYTIPSLEVPKLSYNGQNVAIALSDLEAKIMVRDHNANSDETNSAPSRNSNSCEQTSPSCKRNSPIFEHCWKPFKKVVRAKPIPLIHATNWKANTQEAIDEMIILSVFWNAMYWIIWVNQDQDYLEISKTKKGPKVQVARIKVLADLLQVDKADLVDKADQVKAQSRSWWKRPQIVALYIWLYRRVGKIPDACCSRIGISASLRVRKSEPANKNGIVISWSRENARPPMRSPNVCSNSCFIKVGVGLPDGSLHS